ncbi:PIN domain-containing protein [Roseofilum sp. BLCC_M154]|uniref:Ribonuclease VapC n=1 Tax=Roseofilum acuticapitatum BLCC-M154 TaxID=3022444 RepID=A0ABT7AMN3_9CYAN|nr:PIN domain-containing protein [Roseofilum acuticapitatum]MDJ1168159.1 PIN domain-containing protein [Roseofilum acuticapitatum BLCC-M154]
MVRKDYLLDTNVVSAILRKNLTVKQKLVQLSVQKKRAYISGITYYEVKRGLMASNATRKLAEFERICRRTPILFWNDIAILEKAAEIHAYLKKRGMRLEDADIFIAAIAIIRELVLVSHDSDMLRVPELTVEDWLVTGG